MSFPFTNRCIAWTVLAACCLAPAAGVYAQLLKDEVPDAAKGIEVEDRVGEFIPLNLLFKDERGTKIPLARFFKQGKPIVLTMNYSDCPGLCMAQLNNIVDTLRQLDGGGIGDKFEMVSVSIDPTESFTKAALTKQKYVGLLGKPEAEKGWHFLTGDQKSIQALASAIGFHYSYDKASKRYSHAAVTYFLSPEGRICRYFLSLGEEPAQFKFALNDASEGKLGASLSDTFVQMCYSYDPDANRYTADARRLLSFSAGAFVLMLIGFTAPFWFSHRAANAQAAAGQASAASAMTGQPAANQPHSSLATDGFSPNTYTEPVQIDPHLSARQDQ